MLMFGRDLITPVAKQLEPKPRYYGEKGSALRMDMLNVSLEILQNCGRNSKLASS